MNRLDISRLPHPMNVPYAIRLQLTVIWFLEKIWLNVLIPLQCVVSDIDRNIKGDTFKKIYIVNVS